MKQLYSYLVENLKSYSFRSLERALKNYFGDLFVLLNKYTNVYDKGHRNTFTLYLKRNNYTEKLFNYFYYSDTDEEIKNYNSLKYNKNAEYPDKKLLKILEFYNYYISSAYTTEHNDMYGFLIEVRYSKDVTELVKTTYKGIVYHVTDSKSAKGITKSGLRMKGKDNSYRYIENRINFYLAKTDEDAIKLGKEILESKYNYNDVPECVVLKIDVNKYNCIFYHDTLYDTEQYIYTYGANIDYKDIQIIYKENNNAHK